MDIKAQFAPEREAYRDARLASVKAQSWYDNMATASKKGITPDCIKQLKEANEKEASIKEKYAKKVFTTLAKEKPNLLRRRDQVVVSWTDAFGNSFSDISPELQSSLIALIEEKGGQYRLA